MSLPELLLLALGLSMDTFAVAVCAGLGLAKVSFKNTLIIGGYFGFFQAAMPLVGYLLAARFTVWVDAVDHWVAFVLLGFIGARMIISSQKKEDRCVPCASCNVCGRVPVFSVSPRSMIPLALATSIDALAVGISFAFLEVDILPAVSYIGVVTLIVAVAGVKVGQVFGMRFRKKAEFAGGVILVLLGTRIFLDGLGVL